jgi:hypothetical protein
MIRLEPLTGRHDRNGFDCGVEILDIWLRQTALQHQNKGISRTFVAVPVDAAAPEWARFSFGADGILGFHALTSALVLPHDLPARQAKRYPRQIPVTRLGRLAVRSEVQRQGQGWAACCWPMP